MAKSLISKEESRHVFVNVCRMFGSLPDELQRLHEETRYEILDYIYRSQYGAPEEPTQLKKEKVN